MNNNTIVKDSGLNIIIKEEGTGKITKSGDTIDVHYEGYLDDGTVFDSSIQRNNPFSFPLGSGRVIKGWDEGFMDMKVGTKGTLIIPSELGYGERNMGKIPPNSILIFDFELLGIK